MPPSSHAEGFRPFFLLFFIGIWLFGSFIMSHMGWRSFSGRYPALSRPVGRAYLSQWLWFGSIFASYRNVIRVVFTETGIYFFALFLVPAFHPPFLVPWESVRRVEKKDGFWLRGYRLDIQDAAGEIHVMLPQRAADDLFRYHKAA